MKPTTKKALQSLYGEDFAGRETALMRRYNKLRRIVRAIADAHAAKYDCDAAYLEDCAARFLEETYMTEHAYICLSHGYKTADELINAGFDRYVVKHAAEAVAELRLHMQTREEYRAELWGDADRRPPYI